MTIEQLTARELDTLLSGRVPPGRGDLADMADFVMALESAVPDSVRPSRELEVLLTEGLSPEPADTEAGVRVPGRGTGAVGVGTRRMRRMLQLAAAKMASLGLVAKIGVASATVAAGTVGAGAAGVLPAPVQDAVADTVAAVTPFQLPSSADEQAELGGRVSTDATDEEPGVDGSDVAEDASESVGSGTDGESTTDEHDAGPGEDGSTAPDRSDDRPGGESAPDSAPGEAPASADPGDGDDVSSADEAAESGGSTDAPTDSGADGTDADRQAAGDGAADDSPVGGDAHDSTKQIIGQETGVDVGS